MTSDEWLRLGLTSGEREPNRIAVIFGERPYRSER